MKNYSHKTNRARTRYRTPSRWKAQARSHTILAKLYHKKADAFNWLADEPELYTLHDLKKIYNKDKMNLPKPADYGTVFQYAKNKKIQKDK